MRGSKSNLVAVAGIASGCLAAYHPLRKLAGNGLRNAGKNITRTGNTHCLIYIGTAGQRVPDSTAKAGCSTAEGLYLRRMVMGLVLKLEQPFLGLSVNGNIYINAAGIVLFALLQVLKLAAGLERTCTDGSKFHKAKRLLAAAELFPEVLQELERTFEFVLHERFVHGNLFQLGSEGCVAAMVAPICIKNAKLRF